MRAKTLQEIMMEEEFLNKLTPEKKQLLQEAEKRILSFLPPAEDILPELKTGENFTLIQSWGSPALKKTFTEKKISTYLERKLSLEYIWGKIKFRVKKEGQFSDEFLKQIMKPIILEAREFWQDLYQRAINTARRRRELEKFLTQLKQDWNSDIIGTSKTLELLGYQGASTSPLKKLVQQGTVRSTFYQDKYYYPLTDIEKVVSDKPERIVRRKRNFAERKKQQEISNCIREIKSTTNMIQDLEKQIKDGKPYIDFDGINYTEMNSRISRRHLLELQEELRQLTKNEVHASDEKT